MLRETCQKRGGATRGKPLRQRLLCASSALLCACLAATSSIAQAPGLTGASAPTNSTDADIGTLLVIGFMGGHIKAGNMVHREALLARNLQMRNGSAVEAVTFANHDGGLALHAVMNFVDADHDGSASVEEKRRARVVIYGHSWGASEAITLARALDRVGVPVLLTVQVDSVQKSGENDRLIPRNVRQAINFYQREGLLNGRSTIQADDPRYTTILGNQRFSYKDAPINCDRFPWFARTFMKPHIEIENDPAVWNRVEALIQERVSHSAGVIGDVVAGQ